MPLYSLKLHYLIDARNGQGRKQATKPKQLAVPTLHESKSRPDRGEMANKHEMLHKNIEQACRQLSFMFFDR